MSKVTVQSPANIAFIKYWGMKDPQLNLPHNDSISMTLSGCQTITTIDTKTDRAEDTIEIEHEGTFSLLEKNSAKNKKAYEQIERIRALAHSHDKVQIKTKNTFPSDAGIASSASGFSALTGALLLAYGLPEIFSDKTHLSRLVRLAGSGSAVRSVYGGYVAFTAGEDDTSVAKQIANENHWDLVDIIAIVSTAKKDISSTQGHERVDSSPYFETRLKEMQPRINDTRTAIREKNFAQIGPLIEADTISMHAVMMTSAPPIYYWQPGTIAVMNAVMQWRKEGLESYFSIDAGANVHVICEKKNASELEKRLQRISFVQSTIYNEPCAGVHEINEHLF